jgi:hypothetical protein
MTVNICQRCGFDHADDLPQRSACEHCPPWRCEGCGQMDSIQQPCECWIELATLSRADVKALLATGGLSVSVEPPC